MTQVRFRQAARLEKLAQAYLRKKRAADSELLEILRRPALEGVANLSVLILYGNPKIDESLRFAWRRCLESPEWKKRREKYGDCDERGRGTPFNYGASGISEYFCKYFLPDLPGADKIDKFNLIFAKAPPWLLWFTYGDVKAEILGIKVPDLSTVNRYKRGQMTSYDLPEGPFECCLLPDGVKEDPLETFVEESERVEDEIKTMTSRERKRTLKIYKIYKR